MFSETTSAIEVWSIDGSLTRDIVIEATNLLAVWSSSLSRSASARRSLAATPDRTRTETPAKMISSTGRSSKNPAIAESSARIVASMAFAEVAANHYMYITNASTNQEPAVGFHLG
jgi:hypothetical protein